MAKTNHKASAQSPAPQNNQEKKPASLDMHDIEVRITSLSGLNANAGNSGTNSEGKQRPREFAKCNLNIGGAIALPGVKLMQSAETGNMYLKMPGHSYNGNWYEHFFPVDGEYRQQLTSAVVAEYQQQLNQVMQSSQELQAPDPFAQPGQNPGDMQMTGM